MKKNIITFFIISLIINLILSYIIYNQYNNRIVIDTFTDKIYDIEKLENYELQGYILFGRDTCPICREFNKYLEEYVNNNPETKIYKFDTDYWRNHNKYEDILEQYKINQVPTLIKLTDKNIVVFDISKYENIQQGLNIFFSEGEL